ncbi:MAG: thiamine phosphate synthase [Gammaproteobacteria bacterium]|nr:thiamine phosphate synthase [Gammaproteobacteria bacterium]
MLLRGVYAITDNNLLPESKLLESVEQALEGGIKLLQYRNKTGNWHDKVNQARALQLLCASFEVPLIINDDTQLCIETNASGVHIGQSDIKLREARKALGKEAIIGVTCHSSIEAALDAQSLGANYVAFGRFFPSATKPEAPGADTDVLHQARKTLNIPIVAIGGINAKNGTALIDAGADMLAVVNYLFAEKAVHQRARLLAELF